MQKEIVVENDRTKVTLMESDNMKLASTGEEDSNMQYISN